MSSAKPSDRPSPGSGANAPKEEPEFVNEADIPSDDDEPRGDRGGKDGAPKKADVAGVESAAGEEDPGAALDTPPTPSPHRRPA